MNMRRKLTIRPLFLTLVLLAQSFARDTITPTQPLSDDQLLVSTAGTFALGFFSPANSTSKYVGIWYSKIPVQTLVWVANREAPITSSNTSLQLTDNGTLSIVDHSSSEIVWSSLLSAAVTNPVGRLLDTGNFVVTAGGGSHGSSSNWQSFDYPTDTMLPGMKLGYDLRAGLNRNLTAWESDTDPSPSTNCVAMDIHGDPQLTVFLGDVKRWRSGPWTGYEFNGIPEMQTYASSGFTFNFVDNNDEVYYTYDMSNRSILTRLVANRTGQVQRWVWVNSSQSWSLFWFMPNNACEYGKCGDYSVCDPNASPICSCLHGFEPRSRVDWDLGDWSAGCERKNRLECVDGSDGFVLVAKAMLPDTANVTVDARVSLDECRARCLMNCSCTSFANSDVRGNGSGCIIWSSEIVDLRLFRLFEVGGQDFYVRVSAKDLSMVFSHTFYISSCHSP